MSGCGCEVEIKDNSQKRVLIILLVINVLMFVIELGFGWIAESTALIADSLDMLADAVVYGIGLYAVGRSSTYKAKAALLSGYFQGALGILIVFDILRRLLFGSEPESELMMMVGFAALIANVICLLLIQKHRSSDVNMRASWICSRNDVIANAGVIAAGGLVGILGDRWPDLVIGVVVAIVILRSVRSVIRDAKMALEKGECQEVKSNA
ncbi:cation diffusion facilitator family transporter [Alkalimarinus sediminis]|uniref:Cation diffusion facilitator family transporter n=1 Tax=Alkalimarinus sediminis TaxID=1632866 RepID=A0A9E8KQL7_9ALTE|nr:cation diffusion facilitator family transporter [Alkalimarinus sediminis]UZW74902.1 cation diffusion facilitator family transporter [Alkalimarinus sediminis]